MNFNIQTQIFYWQKGAVEDLESAKILIEHNKFLHGLFLCHLVIEKSIKALVVFQTNEIAPRSHNLIYLSELAKLELSDDNQIFIGVLMKYQLQGRYPDYNPLIPDKLKVLEYFEKTQELMLWLQAK